MSFTLHGLPVSKGIAIGHAHLVSHATLEVSHYVLPERRVTQEVRRFETAVETVRNDLEALRPRSAASLARAELDAFVDLHLMLLADPQLYHSTRDLIRDRRCNAEWALVQQMEVVVAQFDEIDDPYLRERKQDVTQVAERVLKALLGQPGHIQLRRLAENVVIVAHDLSPADMLQFKDQQFAGFVTDAGGATSHTAIVARSLSLPAVVGLHHARALIREDEILIVDGVRGVLIVDPDQRILDEYRLRKEELDLQRSRLRRLRRAESVTLDGKAISLQANIELPPDVEQARKVEAAGVGLFRTEFLFMNRSDLPGEDEQFEAYRSVAEAMKGKPVTVRTLDIGADKNLRGEVSREANPALGLRAIRYSLAEPQLFQTQVRAILRASAFGRVRLLIPMLAHAREIDLALHHIDRARGELRARGVAFNEGMAIGGMVEVPAAALALGPFLRRLQFLSIGTNDLIQYTLAIDRTDEKVAHLYDPLHPAVLRLIAGTIQEGTKAGLDVAVCGEMAGDPAMTRLLLGMGLRSFSMHPSQLLLVKQEVIRADADEVAPAVKRLLRCDEPTRLRDHLEKLNA